MYVLGHLLSVRSKYQSIHNKILPCWLVEQSCGEYHERVEPTSRLIESLSDKVSGETRLEPLLVLKRIVRLSVRHATGFEPTIEDLYKVLL